MSAACPLIVYPDVCSPLGYTLQETKGCPGDDLWQNNDQSTETSDIDPKHWFAMAATTVQVGT